MLKEKEGTGTEKHGGITICELQKKVTKLRKPKVKICKE